MVVAALMHRRQGNFEEAIQDFSKAITGPAPSPFVRDTWKEFGKKQARSSSLGYSPWNNGRLRPWNTGWLLIMKPPCNAFNVGSSIWPAMGELVDQIGTS
jgi:hypothetical protein